MFGAGNAAIDQVLLVKTEQMLAPLGLPDAELKATAKQIFLEIKADTEKHYGKDAYSESFGDRAIANPKFLEARLAAGLTKEEVRSYRNRCLMFQFLETKVRELLNFAAIDVARQSGRDLVAASNEYRKGAPIYGDPESWNPTLPANKGFTTEDAPIYVEFAPRVERWFTQTSPAGRDALFARHTSFNAMIRDLVRRGALGPQ